MGDGDVGQHFDRDSGDRGPVAPQTMIERVERTEILPLMGVVKRQGEWTFAYCPAHDDGAKHHRNGAGMSLGLSNVGVLKCFAGCSFGDVMTALRKDRRAAPAPRTQTAVG